jgi:hypothetical protein
VGEKIPTICCSYNLDTLDESYD